jgi:hypothetical protein
MKFHRAAAVATAALSLAVVGPSLPADASPAPIWAQNGYGPGNTNDNPNESVLTASTIGHIKLKWKLNATPACGPKIAPVVIGQSLFTAGPHGLDSYNTVSGARRWHDGLNQEIDGLAISDGLLIVLTSACTLPSAYVSVLTAFNLSTGHEVWQDGFDNIASDLHVVPGVVAVDSSDSSGHAFTEAYRVSDGTEIWQIWGVRQLAASPGGEFLLDNPTSGTLAVAATTGTVLWQTNNFWYYVTSNPDGTEFYVSGYVEAENAYGRSAVDAATGSVIWTARTFSDDLVTSDGQRLYFASSKTIECLDANTGRRLYSVSFRSTLGRPMLAGGVLYAPMRDGAAMAELNASNGKKVATGVSGKQAVGPIVVGGRLYVLTDRLRAYGL